MAQKKKKAPGKKPEKKGISFLVGLLILVAIAGGFMIQVSLSMPDINSIDQSVPLESTIIYSADNSVLGTIHGDENRITVPLSKISPNLVHAVIASEDMDFYKHRGISIKSMLRAGLVNLLHGRIVQGGSTITQQLARTIFLTTKRTYGRKLSEIWLALELEKKFTKEEILGMYLNQVYWGHNTYGADAASQVYFAKHASDLTLSEGAMMAGILGAPEIYSPYKNFALACERRDVTLDKMVRTGAITQDQADAAKREKITISMGQMNKYKYNAPYFTTFVINQLVEKYGREVVDKGGLRVYTSLYMPIQRAAEDAVTSFVSKEGPKYKFSQGALMAIDPNTGYILAMVGGANFDKSEYNRVTQAKRSPGSSFKPFMYAAAMEKGYSPGDILVDAPVTFDVFADKEHPDGKWKPMNFDKKFRGPVTVRYALENSLNIPAIKLLQKIGVDSAIDMARRLGITAPLMPTLSLTLGTNDVSLYEMTSAFGTFATGGFKAQPVSIIKVTDKDGKVLEQNQTTEAKVMDSKIAYIMVDMMKGVIARGTGFRANIGRPAAAKTGTSDNFKDAWFIGYVPQLVAGVWVGNDNNTPMKGVAEVSVCPRIWKMFMQSALKNVPVVDFPPPTEVTRVKICTVSGLLPGQYCPAKKVKWELFWNDKVPHDTCRLSHGAATQDEGTPDETPSDETAPDAQPDSNNDSNGNSF